MEGVLDAFQMGEGGIFRIFWLEEAPVKTQECLWAGGAEDQTCESQACSPGTHLLCPPAIIRFE